jgi:hypothetical protein
LLAVRRKGLPESDDLLSQAKHEGFMLADQPRALSAESRSVRLPKHVELRGSGGGVLPLSRELASGVGECGLVPLS